MLNECNEDKGEMEVFTTSTEAPFYAKIYAHENLLTRLGDIYEKDESRNMLICYIKHKQAEPLLIKCTAHKSDKSCNGWMVGWHT